MRAGDADPTRAGRARAGARHPPRPLLAPVGRRRATSSRRSRWPGHRSSRRARRRSSISTRRRSRTRSARRSTSACSRWPKARSIAMRHVLMGEAIYDEMLSVERVRAARRVGRSARGRAGGARRAPLVRGGRGRARVRSRASPRHARRPARSRSTPPTSHYMQVLSLWERVRRRRSTRGVPPSRRRPPDRRDRELGR